MAFITFRCQDRIYSGQQHTIVITVSGSTWYEKKSMRHWYPLPSRIQSVTVPLQFHQFLAGKKSLKNNRSDLSVHHFPPIQSIPTSLQLLAHMVVREQ